MSDRFKVFIEISQQFIHNGNQAYYFDGPSFPTTSPPPLDHLPNLTGVSDRFREFIEIPQQFLHDGNQICYCPKLTFLQFLTRCTKPTQKEYLHICKAVAIGFAVMGFIGYFVKLIRFPINNILVYVYRRFLLTRNRVRATSPLPFLPLVRVPLLPPIDNSPCTSRQDIKEVISRLIPRAHRPSPAPNTSNIPSPVNLMSPTTPPNYEGDNAKIVSSAGSNTMQISSDLVSPHTVMSTDGSPPCPYKCIPGPRYTWTRSTFFMISPLLVQLTDQFNRIHFSLHVVTWFGLLASVF